MRTGLDSRVIRVERGLTLFGTELTKAKLLAGMATQRQQDFLQSVATVASTCSATLHVHVTDHCSGSSLSGVALTATGPGTTATGTTSSLGLADLVVDAAGSWTVQGVKSGYTTASVAATATCGFTTNVALSLTVTGQVTSRKVFVGICGLGLAGATVELILSGVVIATGTTDSSGNFTFSGLAAGTYTARASKARIVTTTSSSFTVSCGSTTPNVNISPNVASGYACLGTAICADPTTTTLYLTDPLDGASVPLTYSGSTWIGCRQVTVATAVDTNCLNPTARSVAIRYELAGSSQVLTIKIPNCSLGGGPNPVGSICSPFPGQFFSASATATTSACLPRALSATINFSGSNAGTVVYGSGSRTFTISE